ncbi:MAG: cellulase family glycosylhydrolase [Verrucomicrobiia bacterium]
MKSHSIRKIAGVVVLFYIADQTSLFCATKPIQLHPENPHYFLWRGKPTILITSGEHYGAVLNLDFNYRKYLETLAKDRLNNTRMFTGAAYVEPSGAFNIARNTLAPYQGRFISPWKRSDIPGYAGGGNKFDLDRWNDDYFKRLNDFIAYASKLGIVVEVNLFCPFYDESQWKLSPFNRINNINNIGDIARTNVYTLDKNGGLLKYQERFVRKIVDELRGYDNVYYEICNEPYFGGVTMEWQHHIADVIEDAQKNHSYKKLISQNVANGKAKIVNPHPAISIFNFHYANPPDTVEMNYHLNRVIGDNETGFRGTNDFSYRAEGWEFVIAGGGLFNNLDYSFTAGYEDGTFIYPANQPGGGNPNLRRQYKALMDFINSFDFIKMKPDNSVIKKPLPEGIIARALVQPQKAYAIYIRKSKPNQKADFESLKLNLKSGTYTVEWISPLTGESIGKMKITQKSDILELKVPAFDEDIALKVKRF